MRRGEYLERIVAVERIVQNHPDGITIKEIIRRLKNEYGMTAERKSIYSYIAVLTRFMPINTKRLNTTTYYYLESEVQEDE